MKVTRRSSSFGSSSIGRRSSVNARDIERIQQLLNNRIKLAPSVAYGIIIASPVFAYFLASIQRLHSGLISKFIETKFLLEIPNLASAASFNIFAVIFSIQLIFLWILPSDDYKVTTSAGDKQIINANSFTSSLLIALLYVFGATLGFYNGTVVYDHFLAVCILFSGYCIGVILYLHYFYNPNETTSEPFILEFFFGKELQPKILDIDIKNFVTNRIAFTLWALYAVSCIYHSKQLFLKTPPALLTLVSLQLLYIARRQWTEHIFYANLDSQYDKAGFYRLWGVGVFLLIVHTGPLSILANSKSGVSLIVCGLIGILNIIFQLLNSACDLQKYNFRAANGKLKINDKDPYFLAAKYKNESGETAVNLLLGSGYFRSARHLNYTTEFLTFLTWSFLQKNPNFFTYFSPAFLLIILYARMSRDELRCYAKYNQYWIQYCHKVPYLFVPGVI
uniref:7-dehydrocholesterol reductase n=1 Tax=Panagrolaimus sp. PS1159 TaxID=55785 RepID=A0AC35FB07_9BILA